MRRILRRRKDGINQRYWVGRKRTVRRVLKKGKIHVTRPGKEVIKLSEKIKKEIEPLTLKTEVAGSIRRKKANPVDIDFVVIPKNKEQIKNKIKGLGQIEASGEHTIQSRIKGVDVDLYFSDKDSFGAQLMTRTGPFTSNLGNRTLAKNKGLKLNQYGLFKGKNKIAGKTEQDIYKALGKQYKSPEERGKS